VKLRVPSPLTMITCPALGLPRASKEKFVGVGEKDIPAAAETVYGDCPAGPVRLVSQAAPDPGVEAKVRLTEFEAKVRQTLRRFAIASFCA